MNEKMAAANYLPRVLGPKYVQAGNVKSCRRLGPSIYIVEILMTSYSYMCAQSNVTWVFRPCEIVINAVTCDLVGETTLLLLLEAFPTTFNRKPQFVVCIKMTKPRP